VVKTGGILECQGPNIVRDHGRNRFQFLAVGGKNVSWLVWCDCWNSGGRAHFGVSRRLNTSASTDRKWNERSIPEVVVVVKTRRNGDPCWRDGLPS
jgi:hypothetical protein